MLAKIDWSKLTSYKNTTYFSFEVLCYQIAKELYQGQGQFSSIDDSGGGDGVEFYLTFPNGDQWGWQVKFYHPDPRLSMSNRKSSIGKSLTVACKTHPHLKRWFLCLRSDFTPEEQSWFEQTLLKSVSQGRVVRLEPWNECDFLAWFREPRFTGIRNFFFGDLELNLQWFQRHVSHQITDNIRDKFNPALHVETHLDEAVHALLGDHTFLLLLMQKIAKLEKQLKVYQEALTEFEDAFPYHSAWTSGEARPLHDLFAQTLLELHRIAQLVQEYQFTEVQRFEWNGIRDQLENAYKQVFREEEIQQYDLLMLEGNSEREHSKRTQRDTRELLPQLRWTALNLVNSFDALLVQLDLLSQPDMSIIGSAGVGKTHLACHICEERLERRLPALLIAGKRFISDAPLRMQLLQILNVPPTYSWHDFLQALVAAADVYHSRIPIIIDSLHEATSHGRLSRIWEELPGLTEEIAQTRQVVLLTTCRTTYQNAIWPDENPPHVQKAESFTADNLEIAIKRYFDWYKIKADITTAPLAQFEHPLYLKIFCESKNRARQEEKHIYVGEQTLFEVFDEYLKECNQVICKQLGLRQKNIDILTPALEKMATYLWHHQSWSIPLEEFVVQIDGQPLETLIWEHSKASYILHEGLLVCRDLTEGKEVISFTYDLMAGYLIARSLLHKEASNAQDIVRDPAVTETLFSQDFQKLRPLHDDIRRCLAALLAVQTGPYLHELLPTNEIALNTSIQALFEVKPDAVSPACVGLVEQLFLLPRNRKPLLAWTSSTIEHVKHPFNACFWSKLLERLSLPERDKSWTEYLRDHAEQMKERIVRFETTCRSHDLLSPLTEERLHLQAEYSMWMLTSTMHTLRDAATQALYWYGYKHPTRFFELVIQSLHLNDPYISERMLAAAYGVAMARQHDFQDVSFVQSILPMYGRGLYEAMFRPNASYSTTHIFARDYARCTIDIALLHHPTLLTGEQRRSITPPFTTGGIRVWGESRDKNKGAYRDGNHPFGLQIGDDDPMRWLGPSISPYHSIELQHQQARANLWWRIYELGYSFEDFGELDRSIALLRHGNDTSGTDHYGKKYCRIALYELAGYRDDLGLLKHEYEELHERPSFVDIDPSFPSTIQEYHLFQKDLLGDRTMPIEQWILQGEQPDLVPYLLVEELCGEHGPWVLLDGMVVQQDTEACREWFVFPRSFIIKAREAGHFFTKLQQQNLDGRWLPDVPADHYIYAGEVPWCDTYPYNGKTELSFEIGKTSVEEQREHLVLLRNNEPVSEQEAQEFWKSIADQVIVKPQYTIVWGDVDPEAVIETALQVRGWQIRKSSVMAKRETSQYQTFRVLTPVRSNAWEGYHSASIAKHRGNTPTKEITSRLDLCGQPQTLDLFEKNGRHASITFRYGDDFHSTQHFTYLRKDLLDRFLSETKSELMWAIWGEREYYNPQDRVSIQIAPGQENRKGFQQILRYSQRRKKQRTGRSR